VSEGSAKKTDQYRYTQNRELSWLRFNRRVLEEASDPKVPLMERLKFISIFTTNLDEFFMVRVGSLVDLSAVAPEEIDNKSGMNAAQQLSQIYKVIPGLIRRKEQIFSEVSHELEEKGVVDRPLEDLSEKQLKAIDKYYVSNVLPLLSPQIVDARHPAPHLPNKTVYVASLLHDKNNKKSIGLIPLPPTLPLVYMVDDEGSYVRVENIVLRHAKELYGKFKIDESCVISATRNADVSFDSEKFEDADFRKQVAKLLKRRAFMAVIRIELNNKISDVFQKELVKVLKLENQQIYLDRTPLNMKYVFDLIRNLPNGGSKEMFYEEYTPRWPSDLSQDKEIIPQIQNKDRMLYYPYDSVEPFMKLLSEAADREDVVSIKITIYRLASASRIARILCRAAENGKEVTVLMELRARFDEENNIGWSEMLEEAGCRVIYGIENYKCHSKICVITMKSQGKLGYITQIGTGNYNENTNRMYTDLSVMTTSEAIAQDGNEFFRCLMTDNLDGNYETLLVAPNHFKSEICKLIDEQKALGEEGYICIKVNSVTERDVIDKLAEASKAGVQIDMIVRGICCILPGIQGETENIHIISIVGRYLEHARIYCFGKSDEAKLYIGSADMMTRNLKKRVEIGCPIEDPDLKKMLLEILSIQLSDKEKASVLQPDGSYIRRREGEQDPLDSQEEFMKKELHEQPVVIQETPTFLQKLKKFFIS